VREPSRAGWVAGLLQVALLAAAFTYRTAGGASYVIMASAALSVIAWSVVLWLAARQKRTVHVAAAVLQSYRDEQCTLDEAAQALLAVQRRTGCLTLFANANANERERALVRRLEELRGGA
jgi:hypothetical protein